MKYFGCNTRFVTRRPPGYQTKNLIPTTRGRLNLLDRVFPTWEIEGSPPPPPPPPPHQPKFLPLDSSHQRFIAPNEYQFLSYKLIKTSSFDVVIDTVPFFILTSYSFYTQVILILILIDIRYLQNVVFQLRRKSEWLKSLLRYLTTNTTFSLAKFPILTHW